MGSTAYESLHDAEAGAGAAAGVLPPPGAVPVAAPVATVVAVPAVGRVDAGAYGWGDEEELLASAGAAVRRDWRGGLFQCFGTGSTRDWQLCFLSACCMPVAFGANMKRALSLDFGVQATLCFVFVTLTHWIINVASYNKCGAAPPWPSGDLTAASSEFQWAAWEYAYADYKACTKPADTAAGFMWLLTWCFFAYAGYRRIQLRRRFGLPGDDVRDYTAWLLCPYCALCQEARTVAHNRVDRGVWHGPPAHGALPPGGAVLAPPQPAPGFYAAAAPAFAPPPGAVAVPLPPAPPVPPPAHAPLAQADGMYMPPSAAGRAAP